MIDRRSYPAEAADIYCLREGEAAGLLAGHSWRRFVVVGDSIAEGLGDSSPGYPDLAWCDRIAAELAEYGHDVSYLNLGTSNTRAAAVRDTQLGPALEFQPDLALVCCGGYDMLRASFDPDTVEAVLREIVTAFLGAGADVITVGLFDGSRAPQLPAEFREPLRVRLHNLSDRASRVSRDLGTLHVSLTSHPAAGDADIYSSDPRHGTMRSHAISAAETIRRLGSHLDSAGRSGDRVIGLPAERSASVPAGAAD